MVMTKKKWLGLSCLGLAVLSFFSSVSLAIGIFLGLFLFGPREVYPGKILYGKGPNKVAVVSVTGFILETPPEFSPFTPVSSVTSSGEFKSLLREIKKDKAVKALVMRVDSPGGSAVAAEEIYQALKELKSSGIKVVASMGDTAASGAYYVSSIADKIVASPATLTGSIGVVAEITNVHGLYEKLGLKSEIYKSGQFKDILNPARERTEEEKAMLQEILDTTYDLFLSRVSSSRGISQEEVRRLAEGKIYSGKKAKAVGLVDELGGFEKAVEVAKKLAGITEAEVVEYRKEGLLEVLFGGISSLFPQNILASFFRPSGVSVKYLLVY